MKHFPQILFLFAVGLLPTLGGAQSLDARNLGMGGTGVASSDYTAAAIANPALLTRFDEDDDLALTIPAFGVLIADNDDLLGAIDDFQASYDSLQQKLSNSTATPADLLGLSAQLVNLNGRAMGARSDIGFRLSHPSKGIAWAVFLSGNLDGFVVPNIDISDIGRVLTSTNPADLDNLLSQVSVVGSSVTDVGISLAHAFDLGGLQLGVGVSPKMQRIDTYNYSIQIQNFDISDFRDARYRTAETAFNIDAGLSLSLGDSLTLGFVGKNLIGRTVDTVVTNGNQFTYELNPSYAVGLSWEPLPILTLTGDLDLNSKERFVSRDDDVRFAAIGAEIDLWEWLMIRAGYRADLEDIGEDLYTLGVGIGIFDTVRFDVAGLFDPNTKTSISGQAYNVYGVAFQLTIKF